MSPIKIFVGLAILIIVVIIFGGAAYIVDYLKADGGVGVTLISGLAEAVSRSIYLFLAFLFSLIIAGWLIWTGTRRGEDAK